MKNFGIVRQLNIIINYLKKVYKILSHFFNPIVNYLIQIKIIRYQNNLIKC